MTVHFPMKRMKGSILMKNTKTKSIVALAIVLVLKVICFFQICSGKAKEPAIIRSLGFLK